ncbi:MAG: GH32 C-terminal domain-containing protein [Clostridia bacterium]|nr:GH32 C-terminal domain-containing protein [Clostridia bacterium]
MKRAIKYVSLISALLFTGSTVSPCAAADGFYGLTGTWKYEGGSFVGKSGGRGDTFAISDETVSADDLFTYGATVSSYTGNPDFNASIIFGLKNPDVPTERFYDFGIMTASNRYIRFDQTNGYPESGIDVGNMKVKKNTYELKIVRISKENFEYYVDGELVLCKTHPDFEGGHIGMMTNDDGKYENVKLTITGKVEKDPTLDGLAMTGGELDSDFSPDDRTYWSYVPYSTKSVSFSLSYDTDKYKAAVNGASYKAGAIKKVALNQGNNVVTITLTGRSSGVSAFYTVNVVREPDEQTLYKEKTRPQYHFTPYSYQMNDPNGLVYNSATGEYHLFFQCNRPFDTGVEGLTGTTSWGHAVSKDLLHWVELPLAVLPDGLGMAWSGSAVIDADNTSGLFDGSTPPGSRMVLFYASVGGDTRSGYAKESMAYSKDGGRTFIKYEGNPVVKNPDNMYGGGLRDPRVFWYEDKTMDGGGIWVMVTVGELNIFTSHDLKNWKSCGRPVGVDGKHFDSECPDLYPLPVDGDENNVKWVYTGGGIFYIIGRMEKTGDDTVMFVPETEKIYALNGIADQGPGNPAPETYATQTFSADPMGRRVSISWLRDPSHYWEDKHWNSAQSIPVQHSLRTVNGEIKLFSYPVEEVDAQRGDVLFSLENKTVAPDSGNVLDGVRSVCCDIVASIVPGDATEFGFKVRVGKSSGGQQLVIRYDRAAGRLYVDKNKSGNGSYLGVYEPELTEDADGRITLRIMLDRICFDVYGNGGEAAVAGLVYADMKSDGMEFFTNGSSLIEYLTVYDMNTNGRLQTPPDETTGAAPVTDAPETTADNTTEAKNTERSETPYLLPAVIAGAGAAAAAAIIVALRAKKKKK